MGEPGDYLSVNRDAWDERAIAHAQSAFYNVSSFQSSTGYLSDVIRFDVPRLPSLHGLHVVHLMCHIGTDTLSLARLGAASVTGLDFSAEAVREAEKLAESTQGSGGETLSFVEGDVHHAAQLLGSKRFDLVYTSIGVLSWIPKTKEWAAVISCLLKSGGTFFIREQHPVLWTIEEKIDNRNPTEQLAIVLPYFEQAHGIAVEGSLTYAEDSPTTSSLSSNTQSISHHSRQARVTYQFNHGMGEIIQSLIDAGLNITSFVEHDSVPWDALPGRMEHCGLQEYKLKADSSRLPLSFTIQASKK